MIPTNKKEIPLIVYRNGRKLKPHAPERMQISS